MREMCLHRTTREVIEPMMTDTLEVAAALGCRPAISVERRPAGAERVGDHRASTLQDLEKGKPLELDVLLTAVVELAGITGAPVPTLRTVADDGGHFGPAGDEERGMGTARAGTARAGRGGPCRTMRSSGAPRRTRARPCAVPRTSTAQSRD